MDQDLHPHMPFTYIGEGPDSLSPDIPRTIWKVGLMAQVINGEAGTQLGFKSSIMYKKKKQLPTSKMEDLS